MAVSGLQKRSRAVGGSGPTVREGSATDTSALLDSRATAPMLEASCVEAQLAESNACVG